MEQLRQCIPRAWDQVDTQQGQRKVVKCAVVVVQHGKQTKLARNQGGKKGLLMLLLYATPLLGRLALQAKRAHARVDCAKASAILRA